MSHSRSTDNMYPAGFQPYKQSQYGGVAILGLAGILTLTSIIFLNFLSKVRKTKAYTHTHLHGHFIALLTANALQGVGSVMNFKWLAQGGVSPGALCNAQAGIKQAGNVGTALMSLTLSVHFFGLLFVRTSMRKQYFYSGLSLVWAFVIFVVILGPTVLYKPEIGPYFGVAGSWCWITAEYPTQRVYLEYFIEFLSAGLCFLLYLALLLRVRGNLIRINGQWRFRLIPASEQWQLALQRDILDTQFMKVAKCMVWFPIVYIMVVVPIALARLTQFAGHTVPFGATVFTSVLFNLTGFFNVLLLVWTRRHFPAANSIPSFSTNRQHLRASMARTGGLVPFTLERSDVAEERLAMRQARQNLGLARMNSESSMNHGLPPSQSMAGSNLPLTSPFSSLATTPIALPPPSAMSSRRSSLDWDMFDKNDTNNDVDPLTELK